MNKVKVYKGNICTHYDGVSAVMCGPSLNLTIVFRDGTDVFIPREQYDWWCVV